MQQLKNYSRIVVISGTLLIWLIKFLIRPFDLYADWLTPVVGFAPNLIGSFLLPFGAYWLFKKYFLLRNNYDLKITCAFGLLLVIINEYLQLIPVFGRTFDYLDIFASFLGTSIGYIVFARLMLVFSSETSERNIYEANSYDQLQ
jgi:glycopeptide antibiotics resistance protein